MNFTPPVNETLKDRIIEKFGSQMAFVRALNKRGRNPYFVSLIIHGWKVLDKRERPLWMELLGLNDESIFEPPKSEKKPRRLNR